jgi:hypothetical protein
LDKERSEQYERTAAAARMQALEAVRAMQIPDKIFLSSESFSSLGESMGRAANDQLSILQDGYEGRDGYGDRLPFLFSLALRECWFSAHELASYWELNDRTSTGDHGSAQEYAQSGTWAKILMCSVSYLIEPKERTELRTGTPFMQAIPSHDLLDAAGLLWLGRASELLASGEISDAMNWIYEGLDAIGIARMIYISDGVIGDGESERKRLLSDAGRAGARSREKHKATVALKEWVDMQPDAGMPNASESARRLGRRMPKESWDSLEDPERVIRDHLLAKNRLRLACQP